MSSSRRWKSVISIHALREEGDRLVSTHNRQTHDISIHALREEGDSVLLRWLKKLKRFLSTPSARRATTRETRTHARVFISIHALREEGDSTAWMEQGDTEIFLSTPSARRATPNVRFFGMPTENFYPRPPRGGRPSLGSYLSQLVNFYPRPPRGGRPNNPYLTSMYI